MFRKAIRKFLIIRRKNDLSELIKRGSGKKRLNGSLHTGYQNQQTAKLQYNCNDVGTVLLDCPKVWKHLVKVYSKVRTDNAFSLVQSLSCVRLFVTP